MPYPTLHYLALPYFTYLVLPYPTLPYLLYLTVPYRALSYLILPFLAWYCIALHVP